MELDERHLEGEDGEEKEETVLPLSLEEFSSVKAVRHYSKGGPKADEAWGKGLENLPDGTGEHWVFLLCSKWLK